MKFSPPIPSCSTENFCFHVGDYSFGFNGKDKESEFNSGAYDFGSRYFNAALGRNLSLDKLGQFDSDYIGIGNNPIAGIDPSGNWFFKLFGSTSEQRQAAENYQAINGGEVKNWWKESISVERYYQGNKTLPGMQLVLHEDGVFYNEFVPGSTEIILEVVYFDAETGETISENPSTSSNPPGLEIHGSTVMVGENTIYSETWLEGSSDGGNHGGELRGEEGLKKYSQGLDWLGIALECSGLGVIGEPLCKSSDVIDSALDYKNLDFMTASENAAIRLVSYKFDKVAGKINPATGVDIIGEFCGDFSIKAATKMAEDAATDANTAASKENKK